MLRTRRTKLAVGAAAVAAALMATVAGADAGSDNNGHGQNGKGAENSKEVNLQILSINDFHVNIATTSGAFGGVGRADFLAANMRAAEAEAHAKAIEQV